MSVASIHFMRRLNEGSVVLAYDGHPALWTTAKTRKPFRCAMTDKECPAGTVAYRPVGNQQYRYRRINAEALDKAVAAVERREAAAARDAVAP